MKKLFKEKQKGITLIALVITIIVLVILAGVSIAMLTGENGILTQANSSKEKTEIAEAKEQAKLDIMAWRTEELAKGNAATLDDATVKSIITGKEYVNELGETSFTTKSGYEITYAELYSSTSTTGGEEAVVGEIVTGSNKTYTKNGTAKIPVGFMIVPGCDDVSEGLVISDDPNDTEEDTDDIIANGNQFVWIPVTSASEYIRNTTYESTDVSTTAYTAAEYLPDEIQPEIEASITDVEEIGLINEEAEREAVIAAGGFYIGRYEAGDSSATANRTSRTEGTLVSKKNIYVYSYISQTNAKTKSKTFINNENVKSALITGIQWDVTMATINGKNDGNGNTYNVEIASSDRHTGSKATTGQNISDKVYNIYDLEGNFLEYVAEKNTYDIDESYVSRGGAVYYASDNLASCRTSWDGYVDENVAFRLALYVM